jgi:5-methylcytosine-specific restriction endonuclease McrA
MKCSRSFSTKSKRDEINRKVSSALKGKPTWINSCKPEERLKFDQAAAVARLNSKGNPSPKSIAHLEKVRQRNRERMDLWYAGELELKYKSVSTARRILKRYLISKIGPACNKCGFVGRHPDDDHWVVELDHINGDEHDHRPENLRLLCPTCHTMTPTNSGRNKKLKRLNKPS